MTQRNKGLFVAAEIILQVLRLFKDSTSFISWYATLSVMYCTFVRKKKMFWNIFLLPFYQNLIKFCGSFAQWSSNWKKSLTSTIFLNLKRHFQDTPTNDICVTRRISTRTFIIIHRVENFPVDRSISRTDSSAMLANLFRFFCSCRRYYIKSRMASSQRTDRQNENARTMSAFTVRLISIVRCPGASCAPNLLLDASRAMRSTIPGLSL